MHSIKHTMLTRFETILAPEESVCQQGVTTQVEGL